MRIGISLPVRELQGDLGAIRAFAQTADELGYTHLRVPDQVLRPDSGYAHEPLTLLAYVAAITQKIELVPSVIVLPSRQTVLVAKQAAELDVLSGGRLRLGIGVGPSAEEYRAMGADFQTRGERCEEQMSLLKQLWTQPTVEFDGRWDRVSGAGLNPLPVQRPIPLWIGAQSVPSSRAFDAGSDAWPTAGLCCAGRKSSRPSRPTSIAPRKKPVAVLMISAPKPAWPWSVPAKRNGRPGWPAGNRPASATCVYAPSAAGWTRRGIWTLCSGCMGRLGEWWGGGSFWWRVFGFSFFPRLDVFRRRSVYCEADTPVCLTFC